MAMAREEFESWELQNNKQEDFEPNEQQVSEGGEPASILSWLVSNKHVDDVVQQALRTCPPFRRAQPR